MVHPEQIEAVAARAYGYFRSNHPGHPTPPLPEWADLPEVTRIRWRDNVISADRIRSRAVPGSTQEKYVFQSLAEYYDPPAEMTQNIPIEESAPPEPPPEPPPAHEPKPQSKTKRR